jgi:hypothetical protein
MLVFVTDHAAGEVSHGKVEKAQISEIAGVHHVSPNLPGHSV